MPDSVRLKEGVRVTQRPLGRTETAKDRDRGEQEERGK
jgi:hypothetical protein